MKKNSVKAGNGTRQNGTSPPALRPKNHKAVVITDETIAENDDSQRPYLLNPESAQEREKRLAKRKALTLKAFQRAFDNHHARKVT